MARVYKQTCAVIPTSCHPPHQYQFPNYPHTPSKAATKVVVETVAAGVEVMG
jgi:hypothetical protein